VVALHEGGVFMVARDLCNVDGAAVVEADGNGAAFG